VRILGRATVEGKIACEATVTCMLVPRGAKKPAAPLASEAGQVEALAVGASAE
jgi:3-hydroxyacyl-[acyl-carrier-protein] dehydratase